MKKYGNPIILTSDRDNTSAPYVMRHNGYYYHCYSDREGGIFITKAEKLWEIGNKKSVQVYGGKEIGGMRLSFIT